MANVDQRNLALKMLSDIRINLVETTLGSAVSREAHNDPSMDCATQDRLANSIRGFSILYYFAFLQSHLDEAEWDCIKRVNSQRRLNYQMVDWDRFDAFKYVRDCFGHDWRGHLFPETKANTKRFRALLNSNNVPDFTVTGDNYIQLETEAVLQCFELVHTVLENCEIAT